MCPSRLFIYYNGRKIEHTIESDSGAMILVGIKSVAKQIVTASFSPPLDGRIGGGGTRTWLLHAVHGGKAHLAFELRRRWGDEKPVKTVGFELMAQ